MADHPAPVPPHRSPCGACAHHGHACTPGCALAPYFPADDKPERYRYACLLVGAQGIFRSLVAEKISPGSPVWYNTISMANVVSLADAWAADPVHAAHGVVRALWREIDRVNAELAVQLQKERAAERAAFYADAERFLGYRPGSTTSAMDAAAATSTADHLATRLQMLRLNNSANGERP